MTDFFLFPCDEAEDAAQMTVDVVARRIPASSASTRAATSRSSLR